MSDPNENPYTTSTSGDQNAATPPSGIGVNDSSESSIEASESTNSTSQTQKETLDAIRKGERLALIIAAIVAFGTIGQWVTSCNNNASTSKQTERLLDAANRVDDAAESFSRSASGINGGVSDAVAKLQDQADKMEAARKSSEENSTDALNATINQFHQDQRAWVGVMGSGHIQISIEEGYAIKVRIEFQNFGKTPAFNERGLARILTRPVTVPLPSFDAYSVADASKPITLMPGVVTGVTIETNTPNAEGNVAIMDKTFITAIDSGTLEIYLYGSQWYDDAFKKPHRTDFCLLYRPVDKAWASCDQHNYAD